MKRFTQKFFLLAIGMILSVGASAQEAVTKHRFPQFDFTYKEGDKTIQAYVPAWESRSYKNGKHYGCVRFQAIKGEKKNGKYEFESKIVTRGALRKDVNYYADISKTTDITFTDKTGQVVTMKADKISYGHFVPDTYDDADQGAWWTAFDYGSMNSSGTTYDYYVFDFASSGSECIDTKDYTIIDSWTESSGNIHSITEIDDYAFRNLSVSADSSTYWFRPKSVTIPATITKIGQGAFYSNLLTKKVVFASANTIKDIPDQCFMNLYRVEEITFPKTVESIGGAALGGCKLLNKIVFNSTKAPELKKFLYFKDNQNYDSFTGVGTALPTVPSKCIMEVPLHSAKAYVDKDDLYKQFPMSSKISFIQNNKELEMITYCSDLEFTLKQFDNSTSTPKWKDDAVMKAYYVESKKVDVPNADIELTQITETAKIPTVIDYEDDGTDEGSPRYFGVILTGDFGQTYNIFYPNNLLSNELQFSDNCLKGVNEDTPINIVENYLYFVISNGKFHPVRSSGTLGAHKAYVKYIGDITGDYGAREFSISFPGEATGIMNNEAKSAQNDVWYTLQGIQVQQPSKGVFIKNGKKFVIK